MKVYEIQQFGFDGLRLAERATPQPTARQVVLKMRAASLNYRDLLMLRGHYNPRLAMPRVPLSDGVGEVSAVGAEVARVRVGERVAGTFFERWAGGDLTPAGAKTALGGERDGVLAEYVALDEEGVVSVPAHLSDEEAATLPCAALTAWNALFESGNVRAGDTVLTLGTGGVSLFAVQFARLAGARVIVTSGSDEKLARARELGAHETVNYRTTPDWEKRVVELTDGRGVDATIEVGGAGTFNKSVKATRRGGYIALIGVLAGAGDVNLMPVLMNGLRVQGIFVGSRQMFERMNATIALHQLRPVVDEVFSFAEARTAFERLASGQHFGKIALRIAD
jgi:NADPH:quinone reductase-like Zn-dependent oxidoreductase